MILLISPVLSSELARFFFIISKKVDFSYDALATTTKAKNNKARINVFFIYKLNLIILVEKLYRRF